MTVAGTSRCLAPLAQSTGCIPPGLQPVRFFRKGAAATSVKNAPAISPGMQRARYFPAGKTIKKHGPSGLPPADSAGNPVMESCLGSFPYIQHMRIKDGIRSYFGMVEFRRFSHSGTLHNGLGRKIHASGEGIHPLKAQPGKAVLQTSRGPFRGVAVPPGFGTSRQPISTQGVKSALKSAQ